MSAVTGGIVLAPGMTGLRPGMSRARRRQAASPQTLRRPGSLPHRNRATAKHQRRCEAGYAVVAARVPGPVLNHDEPQPLQVLNHCGS